MENRPHWINLGHRVGGHLSHPLSECYKCSECGYERNVFGIIPDCCSNCGKELFAVVSGERVYEIPKFKLSDSFVKVDKGL